MRLALLLLAGCLPQLDDGVVVRGRHVVVHADPAIPVCERSVAAADRYIEDTAAMLGVAPPAIDYYLFDGPTGCGIGEYATASCAINGTVYANVWIHFHELAHAVDDTYPPPLFVEGLAEALSLRSAQARKFSIPRATAPLALELTAFRAGPSSQNYQIAGDFVRYLLERFGTSRYRTFSQSLLALSDQQTTQRAFERVYEISLEDVIADWRLADPATSTLVVPVDHVECHDPIPPVGPQMWSVEDMVPDGCTTGTTLEGTVYVQPTRRYGFEVTEPGLFVARVAGAKRGAVRSCADGVLHEYVTAPDAMRFVTLPLGAGRHAIELGEGATAWQVERLGGTGETCETAPTFTAPSTARWMLEARGLPTTWIRIAYDQARWITVSPTTTAPAFVCTGSCERRNCRAITAREPLEPRPGPLYLKLPAGGAEPASVLVEGT